MKRIYSNLHPQHTLTKMTDLARIQKALNILDEHIPNVDILPYSHNIVGLGLKMLFEELGDEDATKIVRNVYPELKELGWTHYFIDNE